MNRYIPSSDEEYIFGTLLIIANRCITIMDKTLKPYDVTAMQWMLTIVLNSYINYSPSLSEVSSEMGSSHQNVKQIALKLAQKGLLNINVDEHDARIKRLENSRQSIDFWYQIQPLAVSFMESFFQKIPPDELSVLRIALQHIYENLQIMEETMTQI